MDSGREAVSHLTPDGQSQALPAASFESTDSEGSSVQGTPSTGRHRRDPYNRLTRPDKATRDSAMSKMDDLKNDPRMSPQGNPMPFDGKRMIFGGFAPVVTLEQ
jgi:hypothetical protein